MGNLKVVRLCGTQKSPADDNVLQTGLARLCKMHYTGFWRVGILAEQVKNTHFALKKPPVFKGKILKNRRGNLAQKAGFEPALRLSHTTPLAGEPLEPLGYFCLDSVQPKRYNTIPYFFCIVKAFSR